MRRILALTVTLALLGPASLRAQESTTRGFNIGLHFEGASLTVDDERSNAGGGGLWIGYGFNRTFQLFVQLDAAEFDVDDTDLDGIWTMGHADIGGRFHFANSLRTWVPYLQAALTGRIVAVEDAIVAGNPETDVSVFGGAFSLGGGILFYFSQTWSMDLQVMWSGGEFTQIEVDGVTADLPNAIDAQSTRLNIGVSWWP